MPIWQKKRKRAAHALEVEVIPADAQNHRV